MTAAQRRSEIASLLANGLIRLRSASGHQPAENVARESRFELAFSGHQRVHSHPVHKEQYLVMMDTPSRFPATPPSVLAQIARLPALPMSEIRELWQKLFGADTPNYNRPFLERRIA